MPKPMRPGTEFCSRACLAGDEEPLGPVEWAAEEGWEKLERKAERSAWVVIMSTGPASPSALPVLARELDADTLPLGSWVGGTESWADGSIGSCCC